MRALLRIAVGLCLAVFTKAAGEEALEPTVVSSPVAASLATSQEIPFQLREGLIWVEVYTPQSPAPLHFLLDSGAGVSVLNLPTAQRLGLKAGRRVTVDGVGARTTGYWPEQLAAKAAGTPLPQHYLAVDLTAFSSACKCAVDGLIGADFFRDRVVQIDFARHTLRLLPQASPSPDQESLPLQARHGAWQVAVSVNHSTRRWVRLDTGCASNLHWVTSAKATPGQSRKYSVALTSFSVGLASDLVQLGSRVFEAVPTELHSHPIFPGEAGLLGTGLLSRFETVTIDAKTGRLWLGRPLNS